MIFFCQPGMLTTKIEKLYISPICKYFLLSNLSQSVYNSIEPDSIYLFNVNNRNTKKSCEICSKLIIKTPELRQWRHSGVFIVNFEHILHRYRSGKSEYFNSSFNPSKAGLFEGNFFWGGFNLTPLSYFKKN